MTSANKLNVKEEIASGGASGGDVSVQAPLTCYKYVSGASALRILATGSLYFASPDQLNDSLEANFDFADASRFAAVFNTTLNELALRRGYAGDLSYPAEPPEGLQPVNEEENANFRLGCREVGIFPMRRHSGGCDTPGPGSEGRFFCACLCLAP